MVESKYDFALKVHWCKFENMPMSLFSYENNVSKISH